ncbi:hypothetical protein JCM6882_008301 [Rhodosporidiobolus microsporus]
MTDVSAIVKFVVDEDDPRAQPHDFCTVITTGKTLKVAPTTITIRDLRPRLDSENAPILDVEGYAVEKVPYAGIRVDEEGWEDAYSHKMADWLCKYLGARNAVYYNYHVRRRIAEDDPEHPKEFDPKKLQPALVAHVDGSQKVAFERACRFLGLSEEEGRKERLAVINLWRPIVGPVMDSPLAVCDARTARLEDLEITTDVYGEGSFARYSPRLKFSYLRDMMPDEMLMLRCFDSTKGPSEGGVTIHTGFVDEERSGPGWPLRQSIEIRCCVMY